VPRHRLLVAPLALLLAAASCSASSAEVADGGDASAACPTDRALAGTAYDLSKSRFSFGGPPVKEVTAMLTRWTGPDGALAIWPNGYEQATLNGNAPEKDLPPLSATPAELSSYIRQYYEGMGVADCQVATSQIVAWSASGSGAAGGAGGTTVAAGDVTLGLSRALHGIPVLGSTALAVFDVDYRTTSEAFYWPEIPASVVEAAVAFQAKLAPPAALAAYKAKLPKDAQGDGEVVIHHSSGVAPQGGPFQAMTSYMVMKSGDAGDTNPELDFDQDGNPVTPPQ